MVTVDDLDVEGIGGTTMMMGIERFLADEDPTLRPGGDYGFGDDSMMVVPEPASLRSLAAAMERQVVALVAAHEESERIASTVSALHALADEVVVVDDGSSDATELGGIPRRRDPVARLPPPWQGSCARGGLLRLPPATVWLLADADLAETAALLGPVVDAVRDGRADVAIAGFPKLEGGGFGIVKRFAARAIRTVAVSAPVSRCPDSGRSRPRRSPPCARSHPGSGSRWG